jgi:hypothetical protein
MTHKCECEHKSHFDDELDDSTGRVTAASSHLYSEAEAVAVVKTEYGTFHMCQDCVTKGHGNV